MTPEERRIAAEVDEEFGVLFKRWCEVTDDLANRNAREDLVERELREAIRISRPGHRSGTPEARLAAVHTILRRALRLQGRTP